MKLVEKQDKYRPTIGNISAAIIVCVAIYSMINPGPEGWGFLAGIYLIFLCIIIMLVDLVFQRFIKNYWIISLIELMLLTGIFVLSRLT
ncbi:hypothetical protein QWY90_03310 [Flavobacterium paronense]|uniref:Uncharacterized protein n=1 Tax=Flavobacterium paronense TaxID=1392775 RepID=A0ABV5GBC9_9FLAO|nr:hypothetical protein [Flavobacterium paronense]MDN3676336.1 hypothetical protein [Flavobacterium paronense]